MRKFTEQEQIRRDKLAYIKENHYDPFGYTKFSSNSNSKDLIAKYENFSKEEISSLQQSPIIIAGRLMSRRGSFAHIKDSFGKIQLYIPKKELDEKTQDLIKYLDLGDIIGIEAKLMKTNSGELTLRVQKLFLLSKALRPLPEKFHGLVDKEERFRRRYVDLIMNDKVKETFIIRSQIISLMRQFFNQKNFMEVETPVLHSILGGAAAKPFITHHNALSREFYLRIATELHLKRLIVGGFDGVYEIGRIFRNEGMDATHNPEFTSLEIYAAYQDMEYMMGLTQNVIQYIAKEISKVKINYKGHDLDLSQDFRRVHMVDLIKENTGVDFWNDMTFANGKALAKEHHVKLEDHHHSIGHIINLFFEEFCEEKIIEPTFVFGHPVEVSPLSKRNNKDSRFTDRFELFICQKEYANAFAELNDPIDQYQRFENQLKESSLGNEEASGMDIDFIEALEHGMPPTAGLGIGIDRLIMLFTNNETIREVIFFPHMKERNE